MCIHNNRSRYTHGFHCDDCNTFFGIDSSTYRSGELLGNIWMSLHNINVDRHRAKLPYHEDVSLMKKEIGIGKQHKNYEDIILRAEAILSKYGKNSGSATMVIGYKESSNE